MKRIVQMSALIMLITNLNAYRLFAHQANPDSIRFTGRLIDDEKKYQHNSIGIQYFSNPKVYGLTPITRYYTIDKNGYFKFSMPNVGHPYKMYVGLNATDDEKVSFLNMNLTYFIIEPGDKVNITITIKGKKGHLAFSGKGADKYTFVNDIGRRIGREFWFEHDSIFNIKRPQDRFSRKFKDTTEFDQSLKTVAELIQKYIEKQRGSMLQKDISQQIGKILENEYSFNATNMFFGFFAFGYWFQQPAMRKQLVSSYFRYGKLFPIPEKLDDDLIDYYSVLSARIAFERLMLSKTEKLSLKDYYLNLKRNYSGPMLDRLLADCLFGRGVTYMFNDPISYETTDSIINDAQKIVKDPFLKERLQFRKIELAKKEGKVIDGQFYDLKGRSVKLSSFKGKVVLIDSWFHGCSGCILLNQDYQKNLYPKYNGNKDFVVLSINFDRTKEYWSKDVASGNYTSDDHINVNTGSAGITHPFLKYYNVQGGPWLMLINADGSIRYSSTGAGGIPAKEMEFKIDAALQQLQKKQSN